MKKTMKIGLVLALGAVVAFLAASCSESVSSKDEEKEVGDPKFGSLTFVMEKGSSAPSARFIPTASIEKVKVEIAGCGMTTIVSKEEVSVTDGQGSFSIPEIPIGNNRVVKIQAYKGGSVVRGAVLYGVVDIKSGANSCVINNASSPKGKVFYSLITEKVVTSSAELNDVVTADLIPGCDASLINTAEMVNDFRDNLGSLSNFLKEDYVTDPGSVEFELPASLDRGSRVYIADPNSKAYECAGDEKKITIKDVAPGTWQVFKRLGTDGKYQLMGEVTVASREKVPQTTHKIELASKGEEVQDDPTPEPQKPDTPSDGTGGSSTGDVDSDQELHGSDGGGQAVSDRVIIHAKNFQYIWYWKTGGQGAEKQLTADGASWYKIEFTDYKNLNIILKTATGWTGSQTPDTPIPGAGEYWYDTSLKTSNPDDSVAPTITSFTADKSGTVSGIVTFKLTASDNNGLAEAQIKDGVNVIVSVKLSGKSIANGEIKWDTTKVKNGSHSITCVVVDAAKNESTASRAISLTTNNELPKPVVTITGGSSVITGKTLKFTGSGTYDNLATTKTYLWTVGTGASITSGQGTNTCVVTGGSPTESVTVTLKVTYNNDTLKSATGTKTFKVREQGTVADDWDFRDETIYFLMTTRFYDGDPSNNEYCWDEGGDYLKIRDGDPAWRGDFKGLAEKLDYIKDLGFTAIWITPVVENASGIDYHGYHAYDFSKVDPRYESHDANGNVTFGYQDLIDACHNAGIKVVQDIVLNHTGNWGENNLFHMFKKAANTTPKDKTTGGKMSRLMEVDDKEGYITKSMGSVDAYNNAVGGIQYEKGRIGAMKTDSIDTKRIYHHSGSLSWNGYSVQTGQIAGDCVDLNTENPDVMSYLVDCYKSYIDMGVDAFRVDTVKHISRWTLNETFNKEIIEHAGDKFFMFGEVCARYRGRVNEGCWSITPSFYTWKTSGEPAWGSTTSNEANAQGDWTKYNDSWKPPIKGHAKMTGNSYSAPTDAATYRSHMDVIDFYMHWAFNDAGDAFQTALAYDDDYYDATWNVTYVDSHDYAPDNAPESKRFNGYWNDKLNLIFTFRGIPCIYYGSEIEFKKGLCIDPPAERTYLDQSGRAYYGDEIAGASKHPLYQQIKALNRIRASCAALRKGQYTTDGCSGGISFKRCYKNSWAAVAINGQATFSGLPSGNWVDATTGDTKSGTGFTTRTVGTGDAAIYILQQGGEGASKIASGGTLGK